MSRSQFAGRGNSLLGRPGYCKEYREIIGLRLKAAKTNLVLVKGV